MRFESPVEYRIIEEIGRGGMGVAYLAERDIGGVVDRVVLKTIRDLDPRLSSRLGCEGADPSGCLSAFQLKRACPG